MSEFPSPRPGPSRERLLVRLACSAVVAAALVAYSWDLVVETLPLLWPPGALGSRWFSLALLLVGSFCILPGIVGTLVGDRLYDYFRS